MCKAYDNVTAAKSGAAVAGYAYTLGAAGNRLSVAEQSGRAVTYTYDAVGNRLSRASTLPGVASASSTYDANDRLDGRQYDADGNVTAADSRAYAYDSENRLSGADGGVNYVYDGDGNRVAKTAGGVTTQYLVDTNNHTGHAQVVEELQGGAVVRQHTYGRDLISQRQLVAGQWQVSFYGYDGQGSVRYLTDAAGAVTDTYTFDAFGSLVARTGTTPNDYLYAGEQFDANIGFYYLRARYYDAASGRFTSTDTYEGSVYDPASLHKYNYCQNNPANLVDPSGHMGIGDMVAVSAMVGILASIGSILYGFIQYKYLTPAMTRGNFIHRVIYPYYGAYGFITNSQIGTVGNPPVDRGRPDARHHGPGPFAGEVYEFKSQVEAARGLSEVMDYIARLSAHDPGIAWHGGMSILAENPLHVPEFPFIVFRLSIPFPGVVVYSPEPDWTEAARVGVTAFTVTLLLVLLRNAPTPAPAPIPVPA